MVSSRDMGKHHSDQQGKRTKNSSSATRDDTATGGGGYSRKRTVDSTGMHFHRLEAEILNSQNLGANRRGGKQTSPPDGSHSKSHHHQTAGGDAAAASRHHYTDHRGGHHKDRDHKSRRCHDQQAGTAQRTPESVSGTSGDRFSPPVFTPDSFLQQISGGDMTSASQLTTPYTPPGKIVGTLGQNNITGAVRSNSRTPQSRTPPRGGKHDHYDTRKQDDRHPGSSSNDLSASNRNSPTKTTPDKLTASEKDQTSKDSSGNTPGTGSLMAEQKKDGVSKGNRKKHISQADIRLSRELELKEGPEEAEAASSSMQNNKNHETGTASVIGPTTGEQKEKLHKNKKSSRNPHQHAGRGSDSLSKDHRSRQAGNDALPASTPEHHEKHARKSRRTHANEDRKSRTHHKDRGLDRENRHHHHEGRSHQHVGKERPHRSSEQYSGSGESRSGSRTRSSERSGSSSNNTSSKQLQRSSGMKMISGGGDQHRDVSSHRNKGTAPKQRRSRDKEERTDNYKRHGNKKTDKNSKIPTPPDLQQDLAPGTSFIGLKSASSTSSFIPNMDLYNINKHAPRKSGAAGVFRTLDSKYSSAPGGTAAEASSANTNATTAGTKSRREIGVNPTTNITPPKADESGTTSMELSGKSSRELSGNARRDPDGTAKVTKSVAGFLSGISRRAFKVDSSGSPHPGGTAVTNSAELGNSAQGAGVDPGDDLWGPAPKQKMTGASPIKTIGRALKKLVKTGISPLSSVPLKDSDQGQSSVILGSTKDHRGENNPVVGAETPVTPPLARHSPLQSGSHEDRSSKPKLSSTTQHDSSGPSGSRNNSRNSSDALQHQHVLGAGSPPSSKKGSKEAAHAAVPRTIPEDRTLLSSSPGSTAGAALPNLLQASSPQTPPKDVEMKPHRNDKEAVSNLPDHVSDAKNPNSQRGSPKESLNDEASPESSRISSSPRSDEIGKTKAHANAGVGGHSDLRAEHEKLEDRHRKPSVQVLSNPDTAVSSSDAQHSGTGANASGVPKKNKDEKRGFGKSVKSQRLSELLRRSSTDRRSSAETPGPIVLVNRSSVRSGRSSASSASFFECKRF